MSQWHLTTTYAHNTVMLAGEDNLCILLKHRTQHLKHSGCGPAGAVGSHAWRLSPRSRSHPETTFQVYKHFDLTGNWIFHLFGVPFKWRNYKEMLVKNIQGTGKFGSIYRNLSGVPPIEIILYNVYSYLHILFLEHSGQYNVRNNLNFHLFSLRRYLESNFLWSSVIRFLWIAKSFWKIILVWEEVRVTSKLYILRL